MTARGKALRLTSIVIALAFIALIVRTVLVANDNESKAASTTTALQDAPRISQVSELTTLVDRSYKEAAGFSATVETTTAAGTTFGELRVDASGNAWSRDREAANGIVEAAYRSGTDTLEQLLVLGGTTEFVRVTGMNSSMRDVLPAGFMQMRESLLALGTDGDGEVKEVTYEDSPAWEATIPTNVEGFGIGSATTATVTIDKATRFPRSLVFIDEARTQVRTIRLRDLVVNPTIGGAFTVPIPAGATVRDEKGPFRELELTDVGEAVGYEAIVPEALPGGFEIASVRVADSGFADAMVNPSRELVVVTYRYGFDTLVVTNRINRGLDQGGKTRDPFFNFEGLGERYDQPISDESLRGSTAHFVREDIGEPYVWSSKGDLTVTVAGLFRDDGLLEVINSLRPRNNIS